MTLTQPGGNTAELGVGSGCVDHRGRITGADHCAHEREVGGVGEVDTARCRRGGFLGRGGLTGQDAFVALEPVDLDQPDVGGHQLRPVRGG